MKLTKGARGTPSPKKSLCLNLDKIDEWGMLGDSVDTELDCRLTLTLGVGNLDLDLTVRLTSDDRLLAVDNAVYVTGSISVEDDDHVRILLSDMKPLKQNGEYQSTPVIETREAENPKRIFIKVPLISERHVTVLERISHFNPGEYQVVLFDSSSRKYSSIKNVRVANTEKVMEKLSDSFGQENIVISK